MVSDTLLVALGLGGLVILVFSILIGKRISQYLNSLILDILDLVLSFIDEPFGGVIGLDWGDWIAALYIFYKERKVSGDYVALFLAIEAANFIPGFDYVTNIIPSAFITSLMFSKYKQARRELRELEQEQRTVQELGLSALLFHRIHNRIKRMQKLLEKEDPVDALKEGNEGMVEVFKEEIEDILTKIKQNRDYILRRVNPQQNPESEISRMTQKMKEEINYGISQIESSMSSKDKNKLKVARESAISLNKDLETQIKSIDKSIEKIKRTPGLREAYQFV
ncbi:hypothetical protein A3K72_01250 [Candidatus Woesearchaeota archaeon RBG_13_36_6]|nr:MAG: hypothetical protein A3K72_01250 [Candidatus Woesearchaeota archaeon RBG_13_36_6]